jgi:hypothetical protein
MWRQIEAYVAQYDQDFYSKSVFLGHNQEQEQSGDLMRIVAF